MIKNEFLKIGKVSKYTLRSFLKQFTDVAKCVAMSVVVRQQNL